MAQATAPLFDSTKRCAAFQPQRRPLSVVVAVNAPQQTVSLFDHLVGAGKQRWRDRV